MDIADRQCGVEKTFCIKEKGGLVRKWGIRFQKCEWA